MSTTEHDDAIWVASLEKVRAAGHVPRTAKVGEIVDGLPPLGGHWESLKALHEHLGKTGMVPAGDHWTLPKSHNRLTVKVVESCMGHAAYIVATDSTCVLCGADHALK